MTLNAAIAFKDVKFLISDVLATGKNPKHNTDRLPTLSDLHLALPEEWMNTVTGLTRKTDIIGKNLTISFSGNGIAAKHILQELWKRKPKNCDFSKSTLSEALSTFKDLGSAMHCEVTGLMATDGFIEAIYWTTNNPGTVEFNSNCMRLAGSGWPGFEEMLRSSKSTAPTDVDLWFSNKVQAAAVCAGLYVRQMLDPTTIWDLSGGAYEAITYNGNAFEYVDDFACFFWEAVPEEGGIGLRLAQMPMRVSYWHDCLHIKQFEYPTNTQLQKMKIGLPRHYVIGPLRDVKDINKIKNNIKQLDTRHYGKPPFAKIHAVVFPSSMISPLLKSDVVYTSMVADTHLDPISHFVEKKDGLHFGFHKDFPTVLKSQIDKIKKDSGFS